jgi:hypothetical protein
MQVAERFGQIREREERHGEGPSMRAVEWPGFTGADSSQPNCRASIWNSVK